MAPVFLVGGLIIATAGNVIDRDIKQVWTTAAARSEVLYERRQGRVKLLLVRGLDVCYGDVQVLFDVDFEIDEGEIVALLGTNGAGKSTLLKAICGVVEADKGAVIFDGRDITHCPAQRDRRARHHPGARRPGRVPEPHRGREPAGRRLARPRGKAIAGHGADRRGARAVPGAAAAASPSRPPTSRAASSRCWRSAWPSSPDPGCS